VKKYEGRNRLEVVGGEEEEEEEEEEGNEW
jgi:hypothetical protein